VTINLELGEQQQSRHNHRTQRQITYISKPKQYILTLAKRVKANAANPQRPSQKREERIIVFISCEEMRNHQSQGEIFARERKFPTMGQSPASLPNGLLTNKQTNTERS
jgi:hypothetical protein